MRIINRRMLRGFSLDDQCRDFGEILREVDGPGDPRRFCTGYSFEGEVNPDCAMCKAYAENAGPWAGERNGVLPGQITIDEILSEEGTA